MNTCVSPLSISTGTLTTIQRCGSFSLSWMPRSRPRRSATRSSWRTAIWYVSESISFCIDGTAIPSHPLFTRWIHVRLSVASWLPLGPILRGSSARTRPPRVSYFTPQSWVFNCDCCGYGCVLPGYSGCATVPGARHPAASPFTVVVYERGHLSGPAIFRFGFWMTFVLHLVALVAALPYLGSCRRAVGQEAWRVSGQPARRRLS